MSLVSPGWITYVFVVKKAVTSWTASVQVCCSPHLLNVNTTVGQPSRKPAGRTALMQKLQAELSAQFNTGDDGGNLSWRCFQCDPCVSVSHERQQDSAVGRLLGHRSPRRREEGNQMELLRLAASNPDSDCRKLVFQWPQEKPCLFLFFPVTV